jgi:micrococcal nuclease
MSRKHYVLLIISFFAFIFIPQIIFKDHHDNTPLSTFNGIINASYSWECDDQGTVSYIVDGDTFDVDYIGRIRLADVDTPEEGDPGYQEAKNYLNTSIFNKQIYVDIDDIYGTGPYGRIIAVCYLPYNSTHYLNINKDLLDKGYASILDFDNEFNPSEWTLYVSSESESDIKPFPFYILFFMNNNNEGHSNVKVYFYSLLAVLLLIGSVSTILTVIIIYNKLIKKPKKTRIKKNSLEYMMYSSEDNFKKIPIKAKIHAESNKALLLNFGTKKDYWIPKSAIHSTFMNTINSPQPFIIENWILKRNKIKREPLLKKEKTNSTAKTSAIKKNTIKNETPQIEGIIMHHTDKALLIRFNDGQEEWIPKSLIHSNFNLDIKEPQVFNIEKWVLDKKRIKTDR